MIEITSTLSTFSLRQKIGLYAGIPLFFVILWMPLPQGLTLAGKQMAAVTVLMALWWTTEAIPLPATSLVPLALFPFLGIMPAKQVARSYGHELVYLFMGGFFIAMVMQKWGLHKRIALNIIKLVGVKPKRIVLGFMIATAFISMWTSNTATTLIMFPMGLAVIKHLYISKLDLDNDAILNPHVLAHLSTALMLGIAYAASIGGMGTLVGTPPNLIFISSAKSIFRHAPEASFLRWMLMGLPIVVIFLFLAWYYLTTLLFPIGSKDIASDIDIDIDIIKCQLDELGKMNKGERYILVIFLVTALAWIFRANLDMGAFIISGWTNILGIEKYVEDSTIAIAAAILAFFIPVDIKKGESLLDWKMAKEIPWDILLLFGGGIALAEGFTETGLSTWLGQNLHIISNIHPILIIIAVCTLITFMGEVASNTAIAAIFMPILASVAMAGNLHPFLLMLPGTLAASCGFMLPVATPPNAIVFSSGYINVTQMAKAGFLLNIIGILLITLITYFVAIPLWDISLQGPPTWAIGQ